MIAKCCAAVIFILLCSGAAAQNWPAKPIRFIETEMEFWGKVVRDSKISAAE